MPVPPLRLLAGVLSAALAATSLVAMAPTASAAEVRLSQLLAGLGLVRRAAGGVRQRARLRAHPAGQVLTPGAWLLSPDRSVGLAFQPDGNLTADAPGYRPLWSSGTYGNRGATLRVQDDGNAVLYRGQPGYRSGLDRDGDGIACEQGPPLRQRSSPGGGPTRREMLRR